MVVSGHLGSIAGIYLWIDMDLAAGKTDAGIMRVLLYIVGIWNWHSSTAGYSQVGSNSTCNVRETGF